MEPFGRYSVLSIVCPIVAYVVIVGSILNMGLPPSLVSVHKAGGPGVERMRHR